MSEPTPDQTPQPTEPAAAPPDTGNQAAEVDKWKALARKHEEQAKANSAAAKRLAQLEDQQKSTEQRLTDQLTAAVTRAETAEQAATRLRVALSKGLPADLADRLRGDDEAALSADADALLALVTPATADVDNSTPGPRPDMTQGRGAATPLNGDPLLRDLKSKLGIP